MIKPSIAIKEKALKECIILWKELAKTGYTSKRKAIQKLQKEKKLKRKKYALDCPFCHYLREYSCENCMWPTYKEKDNLYRCTHYTSPFNKWLASISVEEKQKYANKMVEMLLTIKID
jgi:hypothetical protein